MYFIRPKPKNQKIPTLMFLFKDMGKDRTTTFLRRLIHDLLFLLQLLILLLLLLAIAKPYVNVAKEDLFKNTVLVLDTSASMKTVQDGSTRFSEAVKLAEKNLGTITTLVLVKKTPEAVLIDASANEVRDYLNNLKATDSPTNLYDAISTAGGYAKSDARIVVISDFIDTETDSNLDTAKKTLESQGIKVDFLPVFKPARNVGIVDLNIEDKKTTAVIHNFNAETASVKLKINSLEDQLNISANSQELFSFSTPPGTSKLEMEVLNGKDDFSADNAAFISAPSDVKKKVLLITNSPNPQKTFIYNALSVMTNTQVDIAIPPKIPGLKNYDVFIFKDVNPNMILPGTFKGVNEEVQNGKAAVIMSQNDMLALDYYGLIPLRFTSKVSATTNILPTSNEKLTANIEFGLIKQYFNATAIPGSGGSGNALVIAATEDNTPLITFNALGNGKVFYYGLMDESKDADSSFAKSPVYFVFWKRVIDFATNTPTIQDINYKTGGVLNLNGEQTIVTPKGKQKTSSLVLEDAGLYTLNDRTIAINLENEKESDVSKKSGTGENGFVQSNQQFKEKIPYELTDYLLIAAIIILLIEFIYIKLRGDL
jgi:hypothetical protein